MYLDVCCPTPYPHLHVSCLMAKSTAQARTHIDIITCHCVCIPVSARTHIYLCCPFHIYTSIHKCIFGAHFIYIQAYIYVSVLPVSYVYKHLDPFHIYTCMVTKLYMYISSVVPGRTQRLERTTPLHPHQTNQRAHIAFHSIRKTKNRKTKKRFALMG